MKASSLIKKWTRTSGFFNLFSFVFATILIIVVLYYQFGILIPTNYQFLAPNADGRVAFNYGFEYIRTNGLESFFGAPLGNGTYWQMVLSFYCLSLIFATINFLISCLIIYFGIRFKNSKVLNSGFSTMFLPFVGFIIAEKFWHKFKEPIIKKENKKVARKSFLKEMEESINQKINS